MTIDDGRGTQRHAYNIKSIFNYVKYPKTVTWIKLCDILRSNYKKNKKKTENISVFSKKTNNLNSREILKICKLKQQELKFPLKSQLKHFYDNSNKSDEHNILLIGKKLIGYTKFKKITIKNKNKKKKKCLLLDTMIIHKSYRSRNLGGILMSFNNNKILNKKVFCILQCRNKQKEFYKIFDWRKVKDDKINFKEKNRNLNLMVFNKI